MKEEKRKNHKRGRPPIMTESVVDKIEYAFSIGCNVVESCAYANISTAAFYNYLKNHPSFKDRIEVLKAKPLLKAKEQNMKLLNDGDGVHIRWYLEHKAPEEFSTKQTVDISGGACLTIEERSDALCDFLKRFE